MREPTAATLIPICTYGTALVLASSKTEANEIAAVIFVSLFLAYGPRLWVHLTRLRTCIRWTRSPNANGLANWKPTWHPIPKLKSELVMIGIIHAISNGLFRF